MHSAEPSQKCKIHPTGTLCMLVSMQEGHHNYCLFNPKTNSIYILHSCSFKIEESVWPSHCSSTLCSTQEPLALPSILFSNFLSHKEDQEISDETNNYLGIPGEKYPEGFPTNAQVISLHNKNSLPPKSESPVLLEPDSSL
ncbi:hypothetical protein O181_020907 [Austropuccinia psidii MF-1]|uniref:Uncharacterized protein n=1 Tax=Austropuccinia psidii MF-1 TaxID=1389203 RepID=A0A9Q3CCI9_9BASI|nr:hypothetical protein [Austropuccinia psidii MF-1]